MKFLVLLAVVGMAACAPSNGVRNKRDFEVEVVPGVQTSELQSTNYQASSQHTTSYKSSSVYQPTIQQTITPTFYSAPQPALYSAPHVQTYSAPVQVQPVYNVQTYARPQVYSQPIRTVPVQTVSVQSVPIQSYPVQSYPVQSVPVQTVPVHSVRTVPFQTVRTVPVYQPQVSYPVHNYASSYQPSLYHDVPYQTLPSYKSVPLVKDPWC